MVRLLLVLVFTLICTHELRAELKPSEIVVLARAGDKNSEAVAKYYAKIRKVPTSQILAIPFPGQEEMKRADWDQKFRPAIRKWLRDKKLGNKIKCFVTVWGVPLKIGKGTPNDEQRRYNARLPNG